jgi:hypothetical protein
MRVLLTGHFTSVRFSFAFLRDDECYGDFSPLADRKCVSAHSSCRPLTFDLNGEILIPSSAEQALPGNVEVVVLAFLRFTHPFSGSCLLRIRNS